MDDEIKVLNEKIDFLTKQVISLTARLTPLDELKEDLSMFASDAFSGVIQFLADVDFHFRSEEFVNLIKKLLRNIGNFSKLMSQLESTSELADDITPLAKEIFNDIVEKFDDLDKKGVIRSLEHLLKGLQSMYQEFTPEQIENMMDNVLGYIKLINRFNTTKNLEKMVKVADLVENTAEKKKKVSLFRIIKKARSQEVLRTMDLGLDIAAVLSNQIKK